jgi:hypothetical protein
MNKPATAIMDMDQERTCRPGTIMDMGHART